MSVILQHTINAYEYMKVNSFKKNGLWLESNNYSIDYLDSYLDEVSIFNGTFGDVAEAIKIGSPTMSTCRRILELCGCIRTYRLRMHALIRPMTLELYEEFYSSKKTTLRPKKPVITKKRTEDLLLSLTDKVEQLSNRMDFYEKDRRESIVKGDANNV